MRLINTRCLAEYIKVSHRTRLKVHFSRWPPPPPQLMGRLFVLVNPSHPATFYHVWMILIVTKVAKGIQLNETEWCMPSLDFTRISKRTYPCLSARKRKRGAETKAAGCARPKASKKTTWGNEGESSVGVSETFSTKLLRVRLKGSFSGSLPISTRTRSRNSRTHVLIGAGRHQLLFVLRAEMSGFDTGRRIVTKTNALKLDVGVWVRVRVRAHVISMNYNTAEAKSFTSSGGTRIWLHLILTSGKPLQALSVAWLICYELNPEAPFRKSNNQNKQTNK